MNGEIGERQTKEAIIFPKLQELVREQAFCSKSRFFLKNKHSHVRDIASIIFLKLTRSLGKMDSQTGS